tara:strand:+ start:446 stop:694 length:249 start_codon:yes stop_codon:yes gene_type:complete
MGDLIQFVEFCETFSLRSVEFESNYQIPIWPETSTISPGEVGIVLKSQYFPEVGNLFEVLIGSEVFADIPESKIKYLPTPAA